MNNNDLTVAELKNKCKLLNIKVTNSEGRPKLKQELINSLSLNNSQSGGRKRRTRKGSKRRGSRKLKSKSSCKKKSTSRRKSRRRGSRKVSRSRRRKSSKKKSTRRRRIRSKKQIGGSSREEKIHKANIRRLAVIVNNKISEKILDKIYFGDFIESTFKGVPFEELVSPIVRPMSNSANSQINNTRRFVTMDLGHFHNMKEILKNLVNSYRDNEFSSVLKQFTTHNEVITKWVNSLDENEHVMKEAYTSLNANWDQKQTDMTILSTIIQEILPNLKSELSTDPGLSSIKNLDGEIKTLVSEIQSKSIPDFVNSLM